MQFSVFCNAVLKKKPGIINHFLHNGIQRGYIYFTNPQTYVGGSEWVSIILLK